MMKPSALFLALGLAGLTPVVAQPARPAPVELTQARKKQVADACFEVVVPKPDRDPLTYEKPLPWDLLPFHIRNDKYFSIGTAFAVSKTELLTAFHVLDASMDSRTFRRFFIRDAQHRVFEVDQVTACSQRKDVIRFTVKDHTFDTWLDLNPAFELNTQVFTAGNAMGEGVVIRKGDLIGTLPEEVNGAWNFLRSSADVNGGNSGGPLVDSAGRALGVVVRRNDNVSLTVPAAEILNLKPGVAHFFRKTTYSFKLIEDKLGPVTDEFELGLPASFQELRAQAVKRAWADYEKRMGELLGGTPLFPAGEQSDEALREEVNAAFPSVLGKDRNSGQWSYTTFNTNAFDIPGKGKLKVANLDGQVLFCAIDKPETVSLADLQASPRMTMDLFLKALNVPFTVAGQPVRILSFGEPVVNDRHTDRLGRNWRLNVWLRPWDDMAVITFTAPIPSGQVIVMKEIRSAAMDSWIYDLKKILDFTTLPYEGTLEAWAAYFRLPEGQRALPGASLSLEPGKALAFTLPDVQGTLTQEDVDLAPKTTLRLGTGLNRLEGGGVAIDFRRLAVIEPEWKSSITVEKHLRPEAKDEAGTKHWRNLVEGTGSYDGKAVEDEGDTTLSRVLGLPGQTAQDRTRARVLFTVDLSRSGSVSNREMRKRMDRLSAALSAGTPARPTRQVP